MVASTSTTYKIDGRRYPQLQKGVFRWVAQPAIITGAATQLHNVNLDFNPQGNAAFQRYVSIDQITIHSAVAAVVIAGVVAIAYNDNWEDNYQNLERCVASFEMSNYGAAATYAGAWNEHVLLGRISAGAVGRLIVRFEEINTATYRIFMSGLISDYPIIAPDYLRA